MFLIDDVLLSPIKGILWVFREIHDAAQEEQAGEAMDHRGLERTLHEAGNRADHRSGV